MCGFCSAASLRKSCDDAGYGALSAEVDASAYTIPGDTSTTQEISIGSVRDETLEFAGDQDWFRIDLNAGDTIRIDLYGLDHDSGNGLGELIDPLLRLYDSNGNELAENDDIALGILRDSQLTFTATEDGTYFIEADSYLSSYLGDYRLEVTAVAPPPPASPVDAIQGNTSLNTNDPVLVYFAQAGDTYAYNGTNYVATGVNAYEQAQLWSIFEGVETFVDIDFQITTNRNAADLEWATAVLPPVSGGTLLGFFYYPSFSGNGGYGVLNNNSGNFPFWNDTPGGTLDTGGFMYGVAIHELGHGLGLAHPHDGGNGTDVMQGVSGSSDRGDYDLNSAAYTAMSYNEGSPIAGVASSVSATGHGATFAALDIAALQAMYGANTTHAAGDDAYTLHDTNATGSGAGYYTIWDTGGIDELRYSGNRDTVIDLRAATLAYEAGGGGFLSYVDGVIGGHTIANGVTIENASSGNGNDSLTGNATDNVLSAGAGNDVLVGGDGSDRLIGGIGNDTMTGGAGNDVFAFSFGDGLDTILDFQIGSDLIDLLGLGLGFADLIVSEITGGVQVIYDQTTSGQITLDGVSAGELTADAFLTDIVGLIQILGTNGNDDLSGSSSNEEILGLDGDDELRGAGGDDEVNGGDGSDIIRGGDGDDTIVGGNGADTIFGGDGDDTIQGGSGRDKIRGGEGADVLDGGEGDKDTLDYTSSDQGVTVDLGTGAASGGDAQGDTISGFEDIQGSDFADNLTGNSEANWLRGYAGDDTLSGGDGGDRLRGGEGADTLIGGSGADFAEYTDSSAGVTVSLATGTGSGGDAEGDTLTSIERLRGSAFDDHLTGSDGKNTLLGRSGDDILDGGGNDDRLRGGGGNDTFLFAAGDGDDQLEGEGGSDLALFTGFNSSDFLITDLSGGDWEITHIASGDVDSLTSVETLRFDDMDILA